MVSGPIALAALVIAVFLIILLTAKLKMNAFMVLILVSFIPFYKTTSFGRGQRQLALPICLF